MTEPSKSVYVYVFDINDKSCTDERIRSAVGAYLREAFHEEDAQDVQTDLNVCRTPQGKPYLPDLRGISVSVSHSEDLFVCAVAEENVGVDIEKRKTLKDETQTDASARLLKIANRFFHAAEAKYLAVQTYDRFFNVWTAKESYVKYTGQGIDEHFGDFCVIPIDSEELPRATSEKDVVKWRAPCAYFAQTELLKGYTLCVCLGDPLDMVIRFFLK